MEALFAAPIILFVILCLGVIIRDLLWQSQGEEKKESLANRGHQCGCPWCGHFVPCDRLDCPIGDAKR